MRRAIGARLGTGGREAGFTLPELLVAAAMGVMLMAAVSVMMIGAMHRQPELTKRAENISEARWMLERITREIRNGIYVDVHDPDEVSFRAYVRRTSCGSPGQPSSSTPARACQITYTCVATQCRRAETELETEPGVPGPVVMRGIDDKEVFSYGPDAGEPTYIRVTLHIPNPSGPSDLTISDAASLRNAVLEH